MELDKKIETILEKYFEATTTEAEEQELRDYFSAGDIAPGLEQYAPMFQYFSEAKNQRSARQVPLTARRNTFRWMSVAAAAVLMMGLYFGHQYREQQKAEFAYQQTRKALGLIAQNLDRGTEKVAHLSEFEETKQKIYKNN